MRNERPFAAGTAARHIVETQIRREILTRLCEGLGAREPFVLITGEAGVGKTVLVRDAVAAWGSKVAVAHVSNPALTRKELVEEIARRFGAEPPAGGSKPQLLACLERVLADVAGGGQVAVLVIDDAHDLAPGLLEELRLIANAESKAGRRFEVVLAGLPALEARLADTELAALRQRVSVHCQLKPLSQKETRRHLQEAAGHDGAKLFPREACREIFRHTRGVPRAVNALAEEALRLARAERAPAVTVDQVLSAAATCGFTPDRAAADDAPVHVEPDTETGDDAAETATAGEPPTAHEERTETPLEGPSAERPGPPEGDRDPRVRDWVSRFIAEDEPRFGSRFGMDALDDIETVIVTPRRTAAEPGDAPEVAAHATEAETASSIGEPDIGAGVEASDDGPAEDVPPHPGRRRRRPRPAPRGRRARRDGSEDMPGARHRNTRTIPLAIGFVGLSALAAVILLPRMGGRAPDQAMSAVASGAPARPADDAGKPAPERNATDAAPGASAKRSEPAPPASSASAQAVQRAEPAKVAPEPRTVRDAPSTPAPATGAGPPSSADVQQTARGPAADGAADETPAPASEQLLALDVGTYINPDRAAYERTALASETGLRGWIVKGSQDGVATYRVVLGTFSTLERAQRSAGLLLSRGLVTEAVVVPLPPRSARQ